MRRLALTPGTLATLGALLLIAVVFLDVNPKNPPGFYRDESAIAYNAYTLETQGKDEYGATTPLFIRSFGDYKSPLYVYLLAAVFRITGPSTHAARTLSAVLGLAAVLVLYLLGTAVSRSRVIGVAVAALAGLTPWLFEISRLVFEVALEPLLIALFLLTLHRAAAATWRTRHSVGLGLLLGAIAYTYQAGRVLAPAFAVGIAVLFARGRARQVALTCGVCVATLLPIGIYALIHPHAIQARFEAVTYVNGLPWWRVPIEFARHYAWNVNPWPWLVHGDPNERHHVPGAGSIFFVELGLALAGIVIILLRRRRDPWWLFLLFALAVTPIAVSLTIENQHSLRMIALPVLLPLLAIPALETIAALPQRQRLALAGVLAVAFAVEAVHWQVVFHDRGPDRLDPFEAQVRPVVDAAFRHGGTVYASRDDHTMWADTLFFGVLDGRPRSSVVLLASGQKPPRGAVVAGALDECPTCRPIATNGGWEAYIAN